MRRAALPVLALLLAVAGCPASDTDAPAAGPAAAPAKDGAAAAAADPAGLSEAPRPDGQATVAPSFRFAEQPRELVAEPEAADGAVESPFSLTASDGTGLRLVEVDARGVLEPPLAFTELRLTFENPEPRTLEGRFRVTLPQGASVSRFAMKLGDRWQEGEVVERQAARRAYEDFLHRKQDPALLEHEAGNEFSARVFPIPAKGRKELVVSWSHELERADTPYRLPLRGLPELGRLRARVLVGRASETAEAPLGGAVTRQEVVEIDKARWVPSEDLVVSQQGVEGRLGLRHGNLVVARLRPVIEAQPEPVGSLALLVDTSASRALGFGQQVRLVRELVEGLKEGSGPDTPLLLAAFDQEVELLFSGRAGDLDREVWRGLLERRALGASDPGAALTWLRRHAREAGVRHARVILVTDGVSTAGDTEGDALRAAVAGLGAAEVERLDVVAVGGIRDDALLKRLVTAGLPHNGVVVAGDRPLSEIARRLTQAVRSGVQVEVEGARWVWPETLESVQSGDEVLVYADLPEDRPFSVSLGGLSLAADARHLDGAERPLLQRAWVKARIDRLLSQRDTLAAGDADLREALMKQVVELSVKHRVLSPYTALLVLETEHDYARYGIDRRALADVLTVGPSGIEVRNRAAAAAEAKRRQEPQVLRERRAAKGGDGEARAEAARRRDAMAARRRSFRNRAKREEEKKAEAAPTRETAELPTEGTGDLVGAADTLAPPPATGASPSDAADGSPSIASRRIEQNQDLRGDSEAEADEAAEPQVRRERARPDSVPPRPERLARSRPRAAPSPEPVDAPEGRALRGGGRGEAVREKPQTAAYTGRFAEIMTDLSAGRADRALEQARGWRDEAPGDAMALLALGEAAEAGGNVRLAGRAYGSLIDLFPSRSDLRRHAGQRLERLRTEAALALAADTYAKAAAQRPDHPSGQRLLAFALLKQGRHAEAFDLLARAAARGWPARYRAVDRILKEDLGLVAAAWIAAEPGRKAEIERRLEAAGGAREATPSVRFVLYWETDANDVDFHIHDAEGGHAFYSAPHLPSGGHLYADITQGYGPECFTVRGSPRIRPYPYRLQAHYYSRGPMGYGMGKLQVIEHDGRGGLRFDERPFVVMVDRAYVDLGEVKGLLAQR